ncbi:LPS export ABC transporter permease LptG [Vibrio sp. S11_S32]|uniref:LPS export ABC transporter permease LptG n=1 Tax=Vibrio sp. S11_S32 TaxID=2720225 RepID=UPI0016807C67|nr:LPS export ABC transporter permease LptG [Vibrio sp. S11_S32]
MFKILDWYIGRTIIATSSLCLATLVGLSAIIKYVEQLRKVGKGTYDLTEALYFVILSIPRDIEVFFPMAALLGALIGLGMLAASSELVVMQASGVSKLEIGLSVLKTAVPLMLMIMILGQWGSPQAQKMARDGRALAIAGGSITSVQDGVWAKDGDNFIYIARVNGEHELRGVSIWQFDHDKNLKNILVSDTVKYEKGQKWIMKNVQVTKMENKIQISKTNLPSYEWDTTLTPDKLAVVTVKPEELPLSGLYDYVNYLKESKQDASRYDLAFWHKVFQPLSVAVMMLMALSFVFGPLRSVSMGARILSGIVAGFTFYISSEVFGPMSLVYGIPPVIGALTPSVLFLIVAVMLMRRKL